MSAGPRPGALRGRVEGAIGDGHGGRVGQGREGLSTKDWNDRLALPERTWRRTRGSAAQHRPRKRLGRRTRQPKPSQPGQLVCAGDAVWSALPFWGGGGGIGILLRDQIYALWGWQERHPPIPCRSSELVKLTMRVCWQMGVHRRDVESAPAFRHRMMPDNGLAGGSATASARRNRHRGFRLLELQIRISGKSSLS